MGRRASYNRALTWVKHKVYGKLNKRFSDKDSIYIPSPGAKLRQGEGFVGPVQGRRECGDVTQHSHLPYAPQPPHHFRAGRWSGIFPQNKTPELIRSLNLYKLSIICSIGTSKPSMNSISNLNISGLICPITL